MTHMTRFGTHVLANTRTLLAAVFVVLAFAAPPLVADDLDRLIARLDSSNLHDREEARLDLVHSEKVTLKQIEHKLLNGEFSLEQKQRLVNAARDRFLREPRAAMGISMRVDRTGVEISKTTTGFEAANVIKQGDLLISIDGSPLLNRDHLRTLIIAHDPGDVVSVDIRRKDAPATVRIKLGRWQDLSAETSVDPQTLAKAWSTRSSAYAQRPIDDFGVVDGGLSRKGWYDAAITAEAARTGQRANSRNRGAGTRRRTVPNLNMGGEPRGGLGMRGFINQRTDTDWTRNERLLFQRRQAYDQSLRLLHSRQRLFNEQAELVIEQLAAIESQLAQPDLDKSTRSRLLEHIDELKLDRSRISREIQLLKALVLRLEEMTPRIR